MNSKREGQLLRGIIKDRIRRGGITFDVPKTLGGIDEAVDHLNTAGVNPTVEAIELFLLYVELLDEVFHEHLGALGEAMKPHEAGAPRKGKRKA